jgi:hypothetical protein
MFGGFLVGSCRAIKAWEGGPKKMWLLLLALLIILVMFGAGFALHVLWWVAIAALVIALIGFFVRRA